MIMQLLSFMKSFILTIVILATLAIYVTIAIACKIFEPAFTHGSILFKNTNLFRHALILIGALYAAPQLYIPIKHP